MKQILLLLSISAQFSFGQMGIPAIHNRSFKPGDGDASLLLAQPASASRLKSFSASVYTEKRFLLEGLNNSMGSIGFPLSFGGIGITIQYFGSPEFNQSSAGLIYGKNLGKVDLGIRFNYTSVTINGYGKANTVQYELGSIWQITDRIHSAIVLANPFGGRFGTGRMEKFSSVYRFGLGYTASENVFVAIEMIKEEERPVNFNAGLYYSFGKKFFLQGGIQTQIASPYWVIGYQLKKIKIETQCSYHQQLGFSPALSLTFSSKDEK